MEYTWALITGAGRGIGRTLALTLARQKINIIGVARTVADLESLKKEIEALGQEFKGINLDLSEADAADQLVEAVKEQLSQLSVVCLNAAMTASGPFERIPISVQVELISVNVLFAMKITHALLPSLKKHKRAYIFYFSSQAIQFPMPWMSVYSATKNFIHAFSLALSHELKDTSVKVVSVLPARTQTSIFDIIGVPFEIKNQFPVGQSAQEVADVVLTALQRETSRPIITNIKKYYINRLFAVLVPVSVCLSLAGKKFQAFSLEPHFQIKDKQKL